MNNVYREELVSPNTPTIVNSLTVPERGGYSFKGLIIWSDVDCEIIVKFNLDTIGGGRINGATQTLYLDYSESPYGLLAGDSIVIFAYQEGSVDHLVKSTMLMEQL